MARTTRKLTPKSIEREEMENLIYGKQGARRFTQDTPVLPDVWLEFAKAPTMKLDLLITPHRDHAPGEVVKALEARLEKDRDAPFDKWPCHDKRGSDIAYNQSTVVVRLCFDELVRAVLPMTPWWMKYVWGKDGANLKSFVEDKALRKRISKDITEASSFDSIVAGMEPSLFWMMRILGAIALAAEGKYKGDPVAQSGKMIEACADLIRSMDLSEAQPDSLVWSVSLNRNAIASIWRSSMAVKADAARRLFEVSCADLTWAIIDSGIDANHHAFRRRDATGKALDQPFSQKPGTDVWENNTRVVKTYDFTLIRYLLRPADSASLDLPPAQAKRLERAQRRLNRDPSKKKQLMLSLQSGRNIDWDLVKDFLEIQHTDPPHDQPYRPPLHEHGTHVAGILAADWSNNDPEPPPEHELKGVCPDIKLYDLRALDDKGEGDEFSIMAALQFVRHLNANKDSMVIHGVNLSLSIRHDVANYACGSTPVCEESDRVVDSGVVVVTAAGNSGYLHYLTRGNVTEEGYRSISITDPGNSQGVITVGATHRERAHTYGISYFSSRGPTGDGRLKPDLVAPGEKIVSVVPLNGVKRMDGTSMAAPHVSGAAALLMARHLELRGRPRRIKEILCKTATDLGRERYFQGAGMVDILRALQSV